MLTLHGVALSLLLSWGPTNGFDPTSVYVLAAGVRSFKVDRHDSRFREWLEQDLQTRSKVVQYFVACAFDEGTEITYQAGYITFTWQGWHGLARDLQAGLATLLGPEQPPGGKDKAAAPAGKRRATLALHPEEGKWVSACLMAYANTKRSHQYIHLRGNPPAGLHAPSEAERWTMGYAEGVFFADLLNFSQASAASSGSTPAGARPSRKDLERSFTLSMNLPRNYAGLPDAGWAPPNASNGRTLDYGEATIASFEPVGPYRVAENLGAYRDSALKLQAAAARKDPDYQADRVCVADRRVVACDTQGSETFRPLFVHAPRVVSLASATNAIQAGLLMQAVSLRDPLKDPDQRPDCLAGVTCTGPFRLVSANEVPAPPSVLRSRTLVGLGPNQTVMAVLRREESTEPDPLRVKEERFTAIIRYRGKEAARALIEVRTPLGDMRTIDTKWPAAPGWQWMQVYPVYAGTYKESGSRNELRVSVTGVAKEPAPELDLAGFVSGPPWCLEDQAEDFAGVCTDEQGSMPRLRRMPSRSGAAPGASPPATPGR